MLRSRRTASGDPTLHQLGPLQAHLQGLPALMPHGFARSVLALDAPEPAAVHDAVNVASGMAALYANQTTLQTLPEPSAKTLAQAVALEGDIGIAGAECVVGDTIIIESVALSEAAYFPTLGPTYFTQNTPEDLAALEAAAIGFKETGELPAFLLLPHALTELGAWAGICGCAESWRRTLRPGRDAAPGVASPFAGSPPSHGTRTGSPCPACVEPSGLDPNSAVPFLMAAAVAARRLAADPDAARGFSGAGTWWNPLADLGDIAPRPAFPAILALIEDRAVAVNLLTLRAYTIGADAAWLLELLLWGDDESLARAATRRRLPIAELTAATEQVAASVGLSSPVTHHCEPLLTY